MVYNLTKILQFKYTRSAYQTGISHWEEIFMRDKSVMCLEDKSDCVMSSFQFAYGLFSVFKSEAALSWLQAEAHYIKKPNSLINRSCFMLHIHHEATSLFSSL